MPLSPHEEKALAALEEGLRADDPAFAAVLGATPVSVRISARPTLLSTRHLVALIVALLGLVGAGTLFGHRPAVLAAATGALILPWMLGTARSTARGSFLAHRGATGRSRPPASRRVQPRPLGWGALVLGIVLLVVVLVVLPPTGRAVVGLGLTFVVAPVAAVAVMTWTDRRKPR